MPCPELLLYRPKRDCRISIILLDWSVHESYHSLEYLNRQTVDRDRYELIWLEFYRRKPAKLQEMVFRSGQAAPLLDQWIVAGYDTDIIFNKHRLYNLGLLVSQGTYCVICDSDAIFTPNFVARLLDNLERTPRSVLHMDEIRNTDRRFHPFAYPPVDEILGPGCVNWHGTVSRGLDSSDDMIHTANYGACMAAARADMLAIGGADEHLDYLGYICGPYDMTFRLVNRGLPERWLRDEYIYHVWHPNEGGINTDYKGPHDGRGMSMRSLGARATGRVEPYLENPWIAATRAGARLDVQQLLSLLADQDEPTWRVGCQPAADETVHWLERFEGFNLFLYRHHYYGLRSVDGGFEPKKAKRYRVFVDGATLDRVKELVNYYNCLPKTWWPRLATQPLHQLPWRVARKIGKEIGRLF